MLLQVPPKPEKTAHPAIFVGGAANFVKHRVWFCVDPYGYPAKKTHAWRCPAQPGASPISTLFPSSGSMALNQFYPGTFGDKNVIVFLILRPKNKINSIIRDLQELIVTGVEPTFRSSVLGLWNLVGSSTVLKDPIFHAEKIRFSLRRPIPGSSVSFWFAAL